MKENTMTTSKITGKSMEAINACIFALAKLKSITMDLSQ